MPRKKIIRDSVHGYISIDEPIIRHIVDTQYFQRLRRIEQTSMRCLYPSAHHDRFVHSIGTYSLGLKAINGLIKNINLAGANLFSGLDQGSQFLNNTLVAIQESYVDLIKDQTYWDERNFNFGMACLLHDVGHSPFSHTLENFFGIKKYVGEDSSKPKTGLENKSYLWFLLYNKLVQSDLKSTAEIISKWVANKKGPAPHEIMSSILVVDEFLFPIKNLVKELNDSGYNLDFDIEFIIRCIMGIPYSLTDTSNPKKVVKILMDNCLIRLLNGNSFDVDRLDYLLRDVRMAGFDSSSIDLERLLGSLIIEIDTSEKSFKLALNKSAISVIESFISAYNDLYIWVYGHHKVCFYSEMLCRCMYEADKNYCNGKQDEFLINFFSYENIKEKLISDDDVWVLLKDEKILNQWQTKSILSRSSEYISIWKSCVEFRDAFFDLKAYDMNSEGIVPLKIVNEIIGDKTTNKEFINGKHKQVL